ncbi:hypothetical protein HELRODRAFT_62239, partial [Helobdella robusta]|uniref:Autophagy-related protein n=1 Tax=Helobdella robusta TaxID=6412 RepID=T1FWX7_HELRO
DDRCHEAAKIRLQHPDRIPVILEKLPSSSIPTIGQRKFLVPADITVLHFMCLVKKKIKLRPQQSLFIFVGPMFPSTSAAMSEVYKSYKDKDGFLYVAYSGENTSGA